MQTIEKVLVAIFVLLMLPLSAVLYFSLEKNQFADSQLLYLSSAALKNAILQQPIVQDQPKKEEVQLPQKLPNPPDVIKAVYITSWSASSKKYIDNYLLGDVFKNTEANAVVIDIKDYSGYVSYDSKAPDVVKYKTSKKIISDLPALIKKLHEKNIYTIARISTFEDPAYAKARPELAVYDKAKSDLAPEDGSDPKIVLWQDNNHLNWLSPASTEAQDYNISIAKDALANGFDEVNFDYIRFPSDGKTSNMEIPFYDGKTPRHIVIKNFFARIREQIPNDRISADLFGQSTVNKDDLGIGQIIEDSFEYFDYVCPMIYPSHYKTTFMGFKNPALYPYDVVKYSMETAIARQLAYKKILEASLQTASVSGALEPVKKIAKIRPWLQDFNMGAVYTEAMVKEQIKATQEAMGENYAGYLMWSPSNVYKTKALVSAY